LQILRTALSIVGIGALLLASACSVAPVAPGPVASKQVPASKPAPASRPASTAPAARPPTVAVPNPAPGPAPMASAPVSSKPTTPAATKETIAANSEPAVVVAAEDAVSDAQAQIDLWERIRKGFAMQELPTPLVAEKEKFYTTKPEYMQRMFSRGGRYLFHIVEEVEKRGLPMELALLPFVESAMNPVAISSAKASGLWQFMPATGKQYNLNQNFWVDNRRDVVQSTRAALDYLQKIYAMHGNDWFLALASYNWGEGSVGRAIKKNRDAGKPTDYLSLDMPNETRHYIPKLIAIKNILAKSAELGVVLPPLPNRAYFVTIEKTRPIDLKLAAKFSGMTVEDFVALNPAHNRPVIAASKNNEIKIPADKLKGFISAVEEHSDAQRVFATWQPHTMQPGETLESLAVKGNVSVAELRKANGIRTETRVVAGTRIIAPQKAVADETKVESFVAPRVYEQVDLAAAYHRVAKKETLAKIASRYGVSEGELRAWNGVKSAKRGANLLVRQARTQTLLTTETGERSVVKNIVKAVYRAPVAEVPEAPAKNAKTKSTKAAKTAKPAESSQSSSKSKKAAKVDKGAEKANSAKPAKSAKTANEKSEKVAKASDKKSADKKAKKS
jgi:membrane-bound lytic murein transglycosylase D